MILSSILLQRRGEQMQSEIGIICGYYHSYHCMEEKRWGVFREVKHTHKFGYFYM